MQLRLFNYNESRILSSHSNSHIFYYVADRLTSKIIEDLKSGNGATTFTVTASYLDDRAGLHCDKWIEETAMHMSRYSAAQNLADKPQMSIPPSPGMTLHKDIRRLMIQYKSFSGDVSGVIGEAIFSSLLVLHYGLSDNDFAHFRADKQSGIFPDFGIFAVSSDLESRLRWDGAPLRQPVIPAEVKTVTTASAGDIRPKLLKAIAQVQNFWIRINHPGNITSSNESAIVCIAIRNQHLLSYDVALIWGR